MPHHLSPEPCSLPPPAARHYHSTLSIWLSVDPMSDKYPGLSPYVYCGNNPVRLVDEDGRDVWIVAYGAGYTNSDNIGGPHDLGDGFKLNAQAYANKIRNSPGFNPENDEVVLVEAKSMEQLVAATNKEYDKGKIVELTLFSHGTNAAACLGGQTDNEVGEEKSFLQRKNYDLRELNYTTMSQIDRDNFTNNATVRFFGCRIGGVTKDDMDVSFAQYFANYLGGDRRVQAFVGPAEFTRNSSGQVTYPGRMIRSADKKNQKTNLSTYIPQ